MEGGGLIGAEEISFGGGERGGVAGTLERGIVLQLDLFFQLVDACLEDLDLLLQRRLGGCSGSGGMSGDGGAGGGRRVGGCNLGCHLGRLRRRGRGGLCQTRTGGCGGQGRQRHDARQDSHQVSRRDSRLGIPKKTSHVLLRFPGNFMVE